MEQLSADQIKTKQKEALKGIQDATSVQFVAGLLLAGTLIGSGLMAAATASHKKIQMVVETSGAVVSVTAVAAIAQVRRKRKKLIRRFFDLQHLSQVEHA